MATWTPRDIPPLEGKVAVVTGANSGLGLETVRGLAGAGAEVIMACRTRARAEQAIAALEGDGISPNLLSFRPLDLASLDSVEAFATALANERESLDLLVNNAGVMALPYGTTADGFEMQFGTDHLGHFALTGRVLPLLLQGGPARIVTVGSVAHIGGFIRFGDLHSRRFYNKWQAYCQSKLANLVHAFELGRRLERANAPVTVLAAHPGYAATKLVSAGARMMGSRLRTRMFELGNSLLAQDPAAGAMPTLYAATSPDARGGEYYGPDGLLELKGAPTLVRARSRTHDTALAERLWRVSVELTGVEYPL